MLRQKFHRPGCQQHHEVGEQLSFTADRAQLEFAAAADHVAQHLIKRELIFSRPAGDDTTDFPTMAAEECRGRFVGPMTRRVRKEAQEILVVRRRMLDGV